MFLIDRSAKIGSIMIRIAFIAVALAILVAIAREIIAGINC
jgi:hypothetical protein